MRRQWIGLLLVALALAGCGSTSDDEVASAGGGKTASASATAEASDRDEMTVKFTQCLRENGVDIDDPAPGEPVRIKGGPGSKDTIEKAMEACRQYNPQAEAAGNPAMDENNRKFAVCMRENGVEAFPDPEPGQAGVRIDKAIADDPDFAAAQEKCEPILAGGR